MAVNLIGNEIVLVQGIAEDGWPSGQQEQTTTLAIANLGGGGGLSGASIIVSGSTVNAVLANFYAFNSASGAPKSIFAPPATGSRAIIGAVDMFGDAYQNPITFIPDGGDVVIGNQNQIYTDFGSATWLDLAPGLWVNW